MARPLLIAAAMIASERSPWVARMGKFNSAAAMRLTTIAALFTVSVQGMGAYNHPVAWSDMNDLDLRPVFRTQYVSRGNLLEPTITDWSYDLVLRDADNRVPDEFHIPSHLKRSVGFWLRIYTEWTTQHVAIFDSRHPELVYEVLDFRDLARTARNEMVYEIVRKQRVRKRLGIWRNAIASVAARPKGPFRTVEQQIVAQQVKRLPHKHRIGELIRNVRAQTGQRDNIVKGVLAAEAYFPKMEEVFSQMGVPPSLTRLSLVESSFNLKSQSRVGATGVWQFMMNPGHKYLKIDRHGGTVDERLSPLKSTVAAAKLLKENYQRFHNWPLAVTVYNHGLRGLTKMRRQKDFDRIAYLFDPCTHRTPLGWAGRNYYSEFLAVLHAEAYRKVFYGDPPIPSLRPFAYRRLEKPASGMTLALENGVSLTEFRLINPDVRNLRAILPKGYAVGFPGSRDDLVAITSAPSKVLPRPLGKRKQLARLELTKDRPQR